MGKQASMHIQTLYLHKAARAAAIMFAAAAIWPGILHGQTKSYVVTNNAIDGPNTAAIFVADGTPALTVQGSVNAAGQGYPGGPNYAATEAMSRQGTNMCLFVSDGGSNQVAAIIAQTQKTVGEFSGSETDDGSFGIGLAVRPDGQYLYAGFTASGSIATFSIGAGCTLTFLGDVTAGGLNVDTVDGLRASPNGNLLVVANGDGSIQSFTISAGLPVSNNDLQYSTGWNNYGSMPLSVDVTADSKFAIFGDYDFANARGEVEVSNISSGKLTTTLDYPSIIKGEGSLYIWLSPSEDLLYVDNSFSGQITALLFNKTTGVPSAGCISPPLKGYATLWGGSYAIATATTVGDGGVIWVIESGYGYITGYIGIVQVQHPTKLACTLTEAAASPATSPSDSELFSLIAWPPRPF